MKRRLSAVLLLSLAASAGRGAENPVITLAWTGDSHAMLRDCDCPVRPEGSVARRVTLVRKFRTERGEPFILVDSGGFFAGGVYDQYTASEGADRTRILAMTRAMKLAGYDAVCIGDDEFALGAVFLNTVIGSNVLPFVSSNAAPGGDAPPVSHFVIVERGGVKTAIVGVTTQEAEDFFPGKLGGWGVSEPVEAAAVSVQEARKAGAVFVVVLSHLGEELSERIAREVVGVDVVVNGHRKESRGNHFFAGGVPVLQFEFQGRALGMAVFQRVAGRWRLEEVESFRVGQGVPEAADVVKLVAEAEEQIAKEASRRKVRVDYYKMSYCPGCVEAEKEMQQAFASLGGTVDVHVHFVVSRGPDGKLRSLHGERELQEDLRQAAIARFYPGRTWDYFKWRSENPESADWAGACRKLGILPARINGAVRSGEAKEFIEEDLFLVQRLRVAGTPTLFVNNREYEGPIEKMRLLAAVCSVLPKTARPAACAEVPECFADADCVRRGFDGKCGGAGTPLARCIRTPAPKINLSIVYDPRAYYSNVDSIVESLLLFLPGIVEKKIDWRSETGAELVRKHSMKRLPAFVLSGQVRKAPRWDEVRSWVAELKSKTSGSEYLLDPLRTGANQYVERKRVEGEVRVFFSPHSPAAMKVVAETIRILRKMGDPPDVRFGFTSYVTEEGKLAAFGGIGEIEQALRCTAVRKLFPDKFHDYLLACSEVPGSTYWAAPLEKLDVPPKRVRAFAQSEQAVKILRSDAKLLDQLQAAGEVIFLFANQELVPVAGKVELQRLLELAGRRRAEAER